MHVLTGIAHVDHWISYGELKIIAYVRVQLHHVDVLNGLSVASRVMEPHGLGAAPVKGVSRIQRTVLYNGMHHQFGVVCQYPVVEIAFPLQLDLVPCLPYLL